MDISKEIAPFGSLALAARTEIPRPAFSAIRDLGSRAGPRSSNLHPIKDSYIGVTADHQQTIEYQRQKLRAMMAWVKLNDGAKLPELADAQAAVPALLSPMSVVFDLEPLRDNPVISFLGRELEQLSEPFRAPGEQAASASSLLLSLIFEQSAETISSQAPHEFAAKWQSRNGNLFSIAGFALPFSKGDYHMNQVLAAISIEELAQTTSEPGDEADDQITSELLLEQELEPADDPQLAEPPREVPFILVNLPSQVESVRPQKAGDAEAPRNQLQIARVETGQDEDILDLSNWSLTMRLEEARSLAAAANVSETRSHGALYAAIGSAYDLAIAASQNPQELEKILHEAKITVARRAPMTAIVKLVFGSNYDKTRVTEYSAALAHARRIGLRNGALSDLLQENEGGLKSLVQEERRLRKVEQGKTPTLRTEPSAALAKKLRTLPALSSSELSATGDEFVLVLARRSNGGTPVLVGEIPRDLAMLERAARKLVASQD
jgi:hypothetical protein